MGDIYRRVNVCGMKDGRRQQCRTVRGLLDTGATSSVIGRELAEAVGGQVEADMDYCDGHYVDTMAAEIQVNEVDCPPKRRHVIVSDRLAAKAKPGAEMIIGSDYMQRTRMAIMLSTDPQDEFVGCRTDDDG